MKPLFRSPKDQQTHSRSGIAFIVEMLILLILVAGCLSVLIQAFAFAHQQGEECYGKSSASCFEHSRTLQCRS